MDELRRPAISRSSQHTAGSPTCCAPGRPAVRRLRTATGLSVAALWIHAQAPEVRRTLLVPPRAAGRDGPRSASFGPRPIPRSQHSGFTHRLQRFAARCRFPHVLRAGTARGPPASDRDRSLGRSTLDSRTGSRGSPHAAGSPTCCAPGRRAVRNLRTAIGPPIPSRINPATSPAPSAIPPAARAPGQFVPGWHWTSAPAVR